MSKRAASTHEPLEVLLCFQLYLAARNAIGSYQEVLDSIGLTYPQYLVLVMLWNQKTASVKKLGQELGLDSGTLSPLVKRLVEKGFVLKERDPVDERGVLVTITKSGMALESKTECMPEVLGKASKLTKAKYLALINPLRDLNRAMRKTSGDQS